ncbi:MAG: hypothetical protein ACUVWA_09935 [Candidatus Oleimicrobiaceae bacterium]
MGPAQLADNAVTTKLAAGAVTKTKLQASGRSSGHLREDRSGCNHGEQAQRHWSG